MKHFLLDNSSKYAVKVKQKISQAILKFERTNRNDWAYQVTRYENEEGDISRSIEQFTPVSDPKKQWLLVSINENPPSQKQIKNFTEKKLAQAKKKKEGANFSIALREIINLESLELSSENNSHIHINFDVYLSKLGEDAKGKLQGSLSYNKQLAFIESITIVNNAELSPVFSANITNLKLVFTFTSINDSILPHQQSMEMKGTFAFFTEINEVSSDSYSNYSFQGVN